MQNVNCKMQNAKCRMRKSKWRIQDSNKSKTECHLALNEDKQLRSILNVATLLN